MNHDATLVIMTAGMGSRFGGLKQLEPVGKNGEAILDYSVYDAKKAGFNKVVFVIKHAIEKDFRELVGKRIEKSIDVDYVFQEIDALPNGFVAPAERQKPWGTGHAILCCKDVVKTPFAAINADDYYGKEAFSQIYKGLAKSDQYCMVGFRLCNTLTENGHVSRGVCSIDANNQLVDIVERTKIIDCKYEDENGNWIPLDKNTVVSMNMWGFGTDFFGHLQNGFENFLKNNINTPKAEFYLPFMVDELIKKGTKKVNVLIAEDKWYGVTYKEDKQLVVDALRKMTDLGMYD